MNIIERLIEPKKDIPAERKRYSNTQLFRLIVPIIIEQFLLMVVGIADTMMISHVTEAAVSGVSLTNQLVNVFLLVFTAMATGGAVVASQYVGARDQDNGNLAVGQLLMSTTVISVGIALLLYIFGSQLFSLLFGKVEADVFKAGVEYLNIMLISFPSLAIYNSCAGVYRSMGKTRTIMNISMIMNVINVIGNYIGVFILHAGVAGVAWPTVASRLFGAIVMLVISQNRNNTLYVRFRNVFTLRPDMVKRIFTVAIPNAVEGGLFQLSKVALSSIVALFGTAQIAANGVAQSFWSMAALFGVAMGPAFVTVIGQYIGANDPEGADYYLQKLWRFTYVGAIIWNFAFFFISLPLLNLYSLSQEAHDLVIILMIIHNVGCAMFSTTSVPNGFRAAGDIKWTMYCSIFSTVVCRVILSIILGLWMNLGVIGIALAMVGDWAIKTFLVVLRYRSGKWIHKKLI